MSQDTTFTETVEFTKQSALDMRTPNGLTRRTHTALEEGGGRDDDTEWDKSAAPVSPNNNQFLKWIKYITGCGPAIFLFALVVFFFATIQASAAYRTTNTFFNFLHVWATITMMILSIMGLMNAAKIDQRY